MRVTRLKLTKQKLADMPLNDRTLISLLGHVSNEINVLQKFMFVTRDKNSGTRLVDIVEAGQCLILTRILIGKLHEAYELIQKRVSGDRDFRNRYGLNDEWAGKEQLKLVNKFFDDHGKLLGNIRNNLSFHSCDKEGLIETSFSALPSEEPWDFFLADTFGNSFYYASELVMTRSAIGLTKASSTNPTRMENQMAGLEELFSVGLEAASLLTNLFQTLMKEIIDKSFGEPLESVEVEVGQTEKLSAFHMPFFFDVEDMLQQPSNT